MLFFNCSVVFAGFSSEALASRINDGKLNICVLFFKPSIITISGQNIALLNFVRGVHFFFLNHYLVNFIYLGHVQFAKFSFEFLLGCCDIFIFP